MEVACIGCFFTCPCEVVQPLHARMWRYLLGYPPVLSAGSTVNLSTWAVTKRLFPRRLGVMAFKQLTLDACLLTSTKDAIISWPLTIHIGLDKDADGLNVLEIYVGSINSEIRLKKNSDVMHVYIANNNIIIIYYNKKDQHRLQRCIARINR